METELEEIPPIPVISINNKANDLIDNIKYQKGKRFTLEPLENSEVMKYRWTNLTNVLMSKYFYPQTKERCDEKMIELGKKYSLDGQPDKEDILDFLDYLKEEIYKVIEHPLPPLPTIDDAERILNMNMTKNKNQTAEVKPY